MFDAFTEPMKLCNNVFNSERVSVLASTVAKIEDSFPSRIFCQLSMAFSLAVALPEKPCRQGCHANVFRRTDGRTDDRTMAAGASVT
jgi:hypothetical protein